MKQLSLAAAALGAALFSTEATAQRAPCASDAGWAARYSDRSLSTLGTLSIGGSALLGQSAESTAVGAGAEVRWVRSGWALSPRLGGWLSVANQSSGAVSNHVVNAQVTPGMFVGALRPIADRLNLGAMVGYDFGYQAAIAGGTNFEQWVHSASVEGMLTVHLGRSAFIEPRVRASYVHAEFSQRTAMLPPTSIDRVTVGLTLDGGYVF